MEINEAMKWLESGEIREVGLFFCKPLEITEDRLNRPWLKIKKWLIHPETATKYNICNAEGVGYIPLF